MDGAKYGRNQNHQKQFKMKKTVSVNIKGINFLIEEDAYELLQDYLDRLKESLKNESGSQEIIEDVELRIAEISSSKLSDSKTVIELNDIKEILAALGDPEDFIDDENDDESGENHFKSHEQSSEKRLFRDADNAILGGVCAGIANYFKIDVVIIRAIFIVIFFAAGFGIPVYIILWFIVPKAKSTIDRLRMKGRPITVETVREEVENAAENFKKGSQKFANKMRNNDHYGQQVSRAGRILSMLLGLGIVGIGLIWLVVFIIFGIGSAQFIPVQGDYGFLSAAQFGELVLSHSSDYSTFWWGALVAGSCAIIFMLLLGAMLIFRLYNKWSKLSLLALFLGGLTGFIMCGTVGISTGRDFITDGEIEREIGSVTTEKLIVIPNLEKLENISEFEVKSNGQHGFIELDVKYIKMHSIDFKYTRSVDSAFHIRQNFQARSHSHKAALAKSKNIQHSIELRGDSLILDTEYKFPRTDKLRNQEVEIIIEIPIGSEVVIGNQIISFDNVIKDDEDYHHYREKGYLKGNGNYRHYD